MYFSILTPEPECKEIVRVDINGNVNINPEATQEEVKEALIHAMSRWIP